MAKHLVIVESPTKARTMGRYLGSDYVIDASMGHVRDLPQKEFGVDMEHDFEPTYVISEGKTKVISSLKKKAAEADVVYLAPDPDREGEAIAWHLKEALKLPDSKIKRVTFDSFTKVAILEAFNQPRAIAMDLVNAQQARRILDRIVGYKLSPLLWKRIQKGLSAGRVQSVAVRIIVDREKEIREFEARPQSEKEYWTIKAVFSRKDRMNETFEAELKLSEKKELKTEGAAKSVLNKLAGVEYRVGGIEQKDQSVSAPPPFSTDALLASASAQLGFFAKKTSQIAQQLYEGIEVGSRGTVGLITYMRTDSFNISPQAIGAAREFIAGQYGKQYVPAKANVYASSAGAQEAHEAVRPADVTLTPDEAKPYLTSDQHRLYDLIWRRFVACQMPPARYKNTVVEIPVGDRVFEARGKEQVFDGFTRILGRIDKDQILPALEVGNELHRHDLKPEQHFEQPPPRYTEATLIKKLKVEGIGRPSTYSTIITTIQTRKYVVLGKETEGDDRKKNRKTFYPTDLGEVVTDQLVEHFPTVLDIKFTGHMEEDLDLIAEAKADWVDVLKEFNGPFQKDLAAAGKKMKSAQKPSEYKCPNCGSPMVYKLSRGSWFLACSTYPKCKTAASVDAQGKMIVKEKPKMTEFDCPLCGKKMVLRDGRFGQFFACSDYPKCKKTMPVSPEGKPMERAEAEKTEYKCPKCQSPMLKKFSKRGPFLACSAYPKCKSTMNIGPDGKPVPKKAASGEQVDEKCPDCGSPMVKKWSRRGPFLACSAYPKCKTTKSLSGGAAPSGAAGGGGAPRKAPEPTDISCPNCGKMMVIREGRFGKFLACSGYPKCKTTQKMDAGGR